MILPAMLCSLAPGSAGEGRALWPPPSHQRNPGQEGRWLLAQGTALLSPHTPRCNSKVTSASWAVLGAGGPQGAGKIEQVMGQECSKEYM